MPARTPVSLESLYRQAARVTAEHSKSFYFATRFFQRELARSAHAVYWFCRYTDDLVDECATVAEGRRDLEEWAGALEAAFRTGSATHPVLRVFLDAKNRHAIPDEYPLELIEGMRMDLENTRYEDFDHLRVFCYRVASVVGLMMSHVIGFRDGALPYAVDLGIGMQLTNILRDVGEDLGRGRVYLPRDEMARFGYSERDLSNGVRNDAFRALMKFQVARAREFYARAAPGIPMLSADGRFAVQVASEVYQRILQSIERSDYEVFEHRAYVPAVGKYWITARSLALPMARRSAQAIQRSSLATLVGLVPHYAAHYLVGSPLWTEVISEWIMAHTPSGYAVPILQALGPWAKPFAVTGALALLGFAIFLTLPLRWLGPIAAGIGLGYLFGYESWVGQLSFWIPVMAVVAWPAQTARSPARREFVTSVVMSLGVIGVAVEAYVRDQALGHAAAEPVALFRFQPPPERFYPLLVRKAVTSVPQFYGMSKNTVDPAILPSTWRLNITVNGRRVKQYRYEELLALPRVERYVTLRCVSNTLKSDLMGTAAWSGISLARLIERAVLPAGILETAVVGVDGHGDSLGLDYAFSDEVFLALGMNGKTLNRTHGFPLRLIAPRYYGFKNVKWISEIAFMDRPYIGTWPKMGYTKEPVIHIASHIDRVAGPQIGGVSFAGTRGIRRVLVRADGGAWVDAALEPPLSGFTWTRWYAGLHKVPLKQVEARAQDADGNWQEAAEGPLFPNGVTGPTLRRID